MQKLALLIFISAFLASFPKLLLAQEETEPTLHQGFDFQPPSVLDVALPEYPATSLMIGREGWVVVNYMVDPDGKAYEAIVLDSSGDKRMEESTLESLEQSTFNPARFNGDVVDGSLTRKYTFALDGGIGASDYFARKYSAFNVAIKKDDFENIRDLLADMEKSAQENLYEYAIYNFSAYRLAVLEGDLDTQLDFLNKALSYSSKSSGSSRNYLSADILPSAYAELFKLEVQAGLYAEAIGTFRYMVEEGLAERRMIEAFRPTYDQLVAIKNDDSAYSVEAEISELLSWGIKLHKSVFYLSNVEGQVDELKLRCQGAYRIFPYQEEATYNLPESWGTCNLEVIGIPDTTFYLTQQ